MKILAFCSVSPCLVGPSFAQRTLCGFGLVMFGLFTAMLVWIASDARTLNGETLGIKPAKFALSLGVYAVTVAWMFDYVRPDRRGASPLVWSALIVIAASTWELAWVTWQAAHGRRSHFNMATTADTMILAVAGLFAVLLVGALLPVAWEVGRRPWGVPNGATPLAVVLGIAITLVLGGGTGVAMAARRGHAIGLEGSPLPLLGWNGAGGDLRIAHFVGIHAMQAIPLFALAIRFLVPLYRPAAVWAFALAYCLVIVALSQQALRGQPMVRILRTHPHFAIGTTAARDQNGER